ncbi:MAG: iron-sulfur cluster assembly protein [Polymorphobacter sp.]
MALKDDVVAALKRVADPSGDSDIATTGRAAGLVVKDDGIVGLVLSVDGLDRVAAERLQAAVEVAVNRVAGVNAARIILTADRGAAPTQGAQPVAPTVAGIRKLIAQGGSGQIDSGGQSRGGDGARRACRWPARCRYLRTIGADAHGD